ncbi:MAG: ribosome maturation factor RimM, partial [Beijerinckiaceae bacterium]
NTALTHPAPHPPFGHLLPVHGEREETEPFMTDRLVILGVIGAPHGVRGELRVKSATADPLAIGDYGPVTLPNGRVLKLLNVRQGGEVVIVRIEGINDRNAAEALKHQTLAVPRSALPPSDEEDDFYHADLIGLRCETAEGVLVGTLMAINDFGAGDILDIKRPTGPNMTLGFTKANVPEVDIAAGRLIVVLPNVVEAKGDN